MNEKGYKNALKLYKNIAKIHFHTDYSSIDFMYPPVFAWKDYKQDGMLSLKDHINEKKFDLYIHFPYCSQKCIFCRQYSLVEKNKFRIEKFIDLLSKEICMYSILLLKPKINNIYFGGGTPILFNLNRVIKILNDKFDISSFKSFCVETTISDLSIAKLKILKKIGVTRLTIGVQSLDKKVLKSIKRKQSKRKLVRLLKVAKEMNFETINFELIAGLPNQTYDSFIHDLKFVIRLKPNSLDIYHFLQTPLTIFYKKNGYKRNKDIDRMLKDGVGLLKKEKYRNYGNDFARGAKYLNQVLRKKYEKGSDNLIALGPSGIGNFFFKNKLLSYINQTDMKKYESLVSNRRFPIEKYFIYSNDELIRKKLISELKHNRLYISSFNKKMSIDLLKKFKKEIDFLSLSKKIEFHEGKLIMKDTDIYVKVFYSAKIIRRCKYVLEKKFKKLKNNYLDFYDYKNPDLKAE